MKTSKIIVKGKNSKYIVNFLKDEFSDFYKKYSQNLHLFISSQFFLRVGSNLLSVIIVNLAKKIAVNWT